MANKFVRPAINFGHACSALNFQTKEATSYEGTK